MMSKCCKKHSYIHTRTTNLLVRLRATVQGLGVVREQFERYSSTEQRW